MSELRQLPVEEVLPDLVRALAAHTRAVLHAPPGAGKTTRVPPALMRAPWLAGQRIVMLEPRRLAARAAATYMSGLLGEDVGGTVGYRVRQDTRVSARTRIEVVTEGVLTRMLLDDPSLDGTGVVIFDEFHERSIHADTGLALTLQSQAVLRPDLRIVVMSATLDSAALERVLGDAPVIRSEGRVFDVLTHYRAHAIDGDVEKETARATVRAHAAHEGDALVFLPGAAEIRRVHTMLAEAELPRSTAIIPLYGDLSREEQDRAIAPSPAGTRKIVLATSIAETSLTIDGVRIVIDSGLMRVPRFSPRTGMTRLATVPVTKAAAEQRRGRAGRTAPGVCYRLWSEAQHAALLEHRPPEIADADLAPLALDLALWGVTDPDELQWIDAPPRAAFSQARELLRELEALDDEGRLTAHGRAIAALALHPRLAHMIVRAGELGLQGTACDLAALLTERDVLRRIGGTADPDVRLRLDVLRGAAPPSGHVIDRGALHRVRTDARVLRQRTRSRGEDGEGDENVGLLIAHAYPDRVAQQRSRGRYLLRTGATALIDPAFTLAAEPMLAVASIGGSGRTTHAWLAAPVDAAVIERHFAAQIRETIDIEVDPGTHTVRALSRRALGHIVLGEKPARGIGAEQLRAALMAYVRREGPDVLPWSDAAMKLRRRLAFLHALDDAWPAVSDDALSASLDEWLAPFIAEPARSDALRSIDMVEALMSVVGWERRAHVDRLAPTHVTVPSGSHIPIDYTDAAAPVLAVRLQEMFGLAETPRIGGDRVPLTLHLLSPAHRPVQVTRDLGSFWRTGYFDVRRDLRGRYPKHYWPDNPLEAEATRRARPRNT